MLASGRPKTAHTWIAESGFTPVGTNVACGVPLARRQPSTSRYGCHTHPPWNPHSTPSRRSCLGPRRPPTILAGVASGWFAGVTAARPLPPRESAEAFSEAKTAAIPDAGPGHPWVGLYTQQEPRIPGKHRSTPVIGSTGRYTHETENRMDGGPEHFGRVRLRGDSVIELTPEYCRAHSRPPRQSRARSSPTLRTGLAPHLHRSVLRAAPVRKRLTTIPASCTAHIPSPTVAARSIPPRRMTPVVRGCARSRGFPEAGIRELPISRLTRPTRLDVRLAPVPSRAGVPACRHEGKVTVQRKVARSASAGSRALPQSNGGKLAETEPCAVPLSASSRARKEP